MTNILRIHDWLVNTVPPIPNHLRHAVNIPSCISQWRNGRLGSAVTGGFPWGRAVDRLLAEKGWKQAHLAKRAGTASSRISEMKVSDRPYMPLVQSLADAFGVPLWEFFVTDEQSAALREVERARTAAVHTASTASLRELAHLLLSKVDDLERTAEPVAPPQILKKKQA